MSSPTASLSEETALAAAVEVVAAGGKVPTKFLALPYGDPIPTRDGRGPYVLRDRDHAEAVIAATERWQRGAEIPIDYDHQGHYAANGAGIQAPAGGWIKGLTVESDGIHAEVEWTPAAEAALASREYRYVSPDFRVDKVSRLATRMVRVSLTNTPNFEIPALAHQQPGGAAGDDPTMSKTLMLSAAGLTSLAAALAVKADELDEAKVIASVTQLIADRDGSEAALASIRTELGAAEDATTEAVIASIQTAKKAGAPDPTQFVPKAGYDELATRLGRIEEERVIASVDAGVAAGKISPAMRQWAIDLGKKDEPALASYLNTAPAIVAGGAQVKGDPKPEKGKLSDEEKVICSQLGVSEADFLKTRDEEAA